MHTISELGLCIRQRRIFDIDGQGRDRALLRWSIEIGAFSVDAGRGRTEPQIQSRGNGSRKRLFWIV